MTTNNILQQVFATIEDRKKNPSPNSYTNKLFEAGEDEIVKKIGEEAIEIILAAKGQGNDRLVEEMVDLLYHGLVLLSFKNLSLEDLAVEMEKRHGQ